jgi:hypothetical protein
MSNRNFDASSIIQRLKDKNNARSIYDAKQNGTSVITNPQNSDTSPQVIMNFQAGAKIAYTKNLGGGYTVDNGGACNQ